MGERWKRAFCVRLHSLCGDASSAYSFCVMTHVLRSTATAALFLLHCGSISNLRNALRCYKKNKKNRQYKFERILVAMGCKFFWLSWFTQCFVCILNTDIHRDSGDSTVSGSRTQACLTALPKCSCSFTAQLCGVISSEVSVIHPAASSQQPGLTAVFYKPHTLSLAASSALMIKEETSFHFTDPAFVYMQHGRHKKQLS